MKPRVLFVDDDPMILASLRRQISMKLPDVELVFCESAFEALVLLEERSPAIVFSDVRMPEMDGPAFLGRIAERYPCTARFAITGQSEVNQFTQTIQVAHQVLGKPTESEKLVELIRTILLFQESIQGASIESHLVRFFQGQSSFTNFTEIFSLIRRDDVSMDSIAKKIEQDLTLKARLLGVANSAYVSPPRPVSSVIGAVKLLGLRVVGAIYSAQQMQAKLEKEPSIEPEIRRSFDYGTRLAIELQRSMQEVSAPDALLDQAFLAASYFSFGRVLFASFGKQEYLDIRQQWPSESPELEQMELERFGVSQEVAGAYKLFLWGFDEDACLVIANLNTLSPDQAKVREAIDVARAKLAELP